MGNQLSGGVVASLSFLKDKSFKLSGTTSANAYKAEIALVRIEDQLITSSMSAALFQAAARLEAISTVRVDGLSPSLHDLAFLDAVDGDSAEQLFKPSIIKSNFCTRNASLEAYWYLQVLRWISETVTPGFTFTPEFILDVHSRCLYGKGFSETGVRFRKTSFSDTEVRTMPYSHELPPGDEVLAYVEDICAFMNSERFSPVAQAGFMHFQFERVRPFKRGLDRTGRALCHALFFSRGLVRQLIPPIALLPAIDTMCHATRLFPDAAKPVEKRGDMANDIDSWTNYCAQSTEVAADIALRYVNAFEKLQKRWSERIGKVSRGSATEQLLAVLPGYPIITVDLACRLTGKGFSATNDAVGRLVECKVLSVAKNRCSSARLFKAQDALDLTGKINEKLLSSDPVSRASIAGM